MSSQSYLVSIAMRAFQVWIFTACLLTLVGFAAPTFDHEAHRKQMEDLRERMKRLQDLPGLDREEYRRYWEEAMKNDPRHFDRLRELRDLPDFKGPDLEKLGLNHPRFGDRLARASDDMRSRLDEARRLNIEEMRKLQRLQGLRDDHLMKDGDWMTKREAMRDNLPPKFTDEDIQNRLKEQHRIMEELDQRRRDEFKRYEMQMEHMRRQKLKEMNEKQRLDAEAKFEKEQEERKHHEKLKHPASKEQLEDVWEHDDGFAKDSFDAKTFFHLHDKNSDNRLDSVELEALFYNEIRKAYPDGGGMEAHEEMARMREHAMEEMDKNKDGMVSLPEFMGYADDDDFDNKEEWKPVVDEPLFTDEEMDNFDENYDDYYDYVYDDHGNIIDIKTKQKNVDGHPGDTKPSEKPVKQPEEPAKQPEEKESPPSDHGQPPVTPQIDDPKAVHIDGKQTLEKDGAPGDQGNQAAPDPNQL